MQKEHQEGDTATGSPAASADEDKRRTKLMELARRRAERGSQTAEAAAASAAGPDENEQGNAREASDGAMPASERSAASEGRPRGPFDRGGDRAQPEGEGNLRRELIRRALEKRLAGGKAGDDDGNARPGRLLRRLQEGGGGGRREGPGREGPGREGAGREGGGRGLLLRRILEKRMESGGTRGPSDREAELEERIRRLEAELKKLTDS